MVVAFPFCRELRSYLDGFQQALCPLPLSAAAFLDATPATQTASRFCLTEMTGGK